MTVAAAGAGTTVHFVLNPRMRTAFKHCKKRLGADTVKSAEFQQLADVFKADAAAQAAERVRAAAAAKSAASSEPNATMAPPASAPVFTLTFAQVQTLSLHYRATLAGPAPADAVDPLSDVPDPDTAASESSPGHGWVHELLLGSSVAALPPSRSGRVQDPAFKRYLAEQRWKQERRDYAALVKDLPGNKPRDALEQETIGSGYKEASRELGQGLNILTLMATGFVLFWYVGTGLFPHNKVLSTLCGVVGLVGAMLLEVCLFVVRDQKRELYDSQQKRLARAQRRKEEQAAAQRKIELAMFESGLSKQGGKPGGAQSRAKTAAAPAVTAPAEQDQLD